MFNIMKATICFPIAIILWLQRWSCTFPHLSLAGRLTIWHTMNGTIQKKKDSSSDFQGLFFVFECSVVIISSHLFNRKDSHTTKTDLHCYGIFNTGNSESCMHSLIVYTLQFNTWGQSLLKLLYNVECISGHKVTTVTKTNAWPSCYLWKSSLTVANYYQKQLKVDVPILPCVFYTFNWLTLTSEMYFWGFTLR